MFLALALAAVLLVGGVLASGASAKKVTIAQFVDPLPIPAVAQPTSVDPQTGDPTYTITMTQFKEKMTHNLPATKVWGYNGYTPGPVIVVTKGQPVTVNWVNSLPTTPLLAIDHSIPGAEAAMPAVRTVVHVHGGHQPSAIDGLPDQWFVPGQSRTWTYPNNQRAANLIFHDHAMGTTRLNVYAGLIGAWVIVDPAEAALNLPSGNFDVPLVMQDRTFNRNPASANFGQLIYPAKWVPEYFGQAMIVNGKAWPYQNVQPRKYRYRVWNGCNDRVLDFKFSNGMTFWQIGTDGGLLEHPAPLTHLVLSPGERADLVVDFSKAKGQRLVLTNSAATPYPYGDPVNANTTSKIMQFRVSNNAVTDPSSLPQDLSNDIPSAASLVAQASQTRDITLSEVPDPTHPDSSSPGDYEPMPLLEAKLFGAPVDVTPTLGTTEVWRYINLTGDTHPIHQHDVMNRIVARIPFDFGAYAYDKANNQLKPLEEYYLGPPLPAAANEDGWKDTVQCPPGFVTVIALTFTDFTGSYVFHCHILSHEEHDMMRPFQVLPAP